jgi:hypothetical protein
MYYNEQLINGKIYILVRKFVGIGKGFEKKYS